MTKKAKQAITTTLCAAAALVLSAESASAEKSTRDVVLGYECDQIDPDKAALSCRFDEEGLTLDWKTRPDKLPAQKREYANYRLNEIVVRFFQLGGNVFTVTGSHLPDNQQFSCSRAPNWGYTCTLCEWVDDPEGGQTCERVHD